MYNPLKKLAAALLLLGAPLASVAQDSTATRVPDIEVAAATTINLGSGDFAPYYISSLTHGKITQSKGWLLDLLVEHRLDTTRRFSWSAGAEVLGGVTSQVPYQKWDSEGGVYTHNMRAPWVWLQQLYGQVKYRGVYLLVGMKNQESYLLDNSLTSGDLTESGNSRPIPQARIGFINFQDIPFTRHWVQIQGELAYGKFFDNHWMEDFYGRGSAHINTGSWYIYRRLYLRSNPSKSFSLTFGLQTATEIGGTTQYWYRGKLEREEKQPFSFGKALKMILPFQKPSTGVGEYVDGNSLGSWDFLLRYRLPFKGHELRAYLQKPWEKGSSLGLQNGWDGLWGVEYIFGDKPSIIDAALFEYIYFMNQSGPIHYAPHDNPGSTIGNDISGGDQYYNNYGYNAYTNYGVGIGTPFLKAPIYNTDGYPQYVDNRVKGFHMAARGHLLPLLRWKAALSYRQAYGDGRLPRSNVVDDLSWMVELSGNIAPLGNTWFKAQIAMDRGTLLGNNFGVLVSLAYTGNFNFRKK